MSAHIAVKCLCHLCSRIPLTRFLRCPRSRWPWLHPHKSAPRIYSLSSAYHTSVPLLYVRFSVTVIIVCEKKQASLLSYRSSYNAAIAPSWMALDSHSYVATEEKRDDFRKDR